MWKEGSLLEELKLGGAGTYLVGRSEAAFVVTEHESCSRRHAEIRVSEHGEVFLRDLGSAQGTLVDNVEIGVGEARLRDLAKIQFASSSRNYLLKLESAAAASSATATSSAAAASLLPSTAVRRAGGPLGSAHSSATPPLSVESKKKLLWGSKKRAAAEGNAQSWAGAATALGGGDARQDKLLSLLGAKKHKVGGVGWGGPAHARGAAAEEAQRRQEVQYRELEAQYNESRMKGGRQGGLGR